MGAISLLMIIGLTLTLFIWGYYRHDVVALTALVLLVLCGLIPATHAFNGFANPAVITVAAVMVITAGINQSGLLDQLLLWLAPRSKSPFLFILTLCLLGAFLSAFMNNVAALALLMPLAIQGARQINLSPSSTLMPLAFASMLGGTCTKIGTPHNILIANYRETVTGTPFSMFDFAPVGIAITVLSLFFIASIGWRLVPVRRTAAAAADYYHMNDYVSELQIKKDSPLIGIDRQQMDSRFKIDYAILCLIRGRSKKWVVHDDEVFQAGDILVIATTHEELNQLIQDAGLTLVHGDVVNPTFAAGTEIQTMEAVVTGGSRIEGKSWQKMRIRSLYGINLLAISRSAGTLRKRLNHVNLRNGDVVLVQGDGRHLREDIVNLGLIPLAARPIQLGFQRNMIMPLALFVLGILLASLNFYTVSFSFVLVVLLMLLTGVISPRQMYQSIDWSIIMLLGCLIPLGEAMLNSGLAGHIAGGLNQLAGFGHPLILIALLFVITMTLSDLMNNTATAVVIAPIAIQLAEVGQVSVDPYLMAVCVGASCSFLTPISHQNNTLIMQPGGYRFADYLRLGIPVEILTSLVAIPMIYLWWG